MRINRKLIYFTLILLLSGCANLLESDVKERVKNGELVLIEMSDDGYNLFDRFLSSLFRTKSERKKVSIVRIDGVNVQSDMFTSSQEVAVKPGSYKIKFKCFYDPGKENEISTTNVEEFELEIKSGHKYRVSCVTDGFDACNTKIQEMPI